ncbi:non-specific serine/threonine protein kinase [Exophiala viscosa]|uniref:Non-specific serine/threonine protein kinase n=1 Tax=Exophiala viscosa TaxID=2486360 RepID=A0AAN6E5P8_9EURO|nr:non-specific serine/threonine protein kinase [Exophiala viscosa]
MEPPAIPYNPHNRLFRDFTGEPISNSVSYRRQMGAHAAIGGPVGRPSYDGRTDSARSADGRTNSFRSHRTKSPTNGELHEARGMHSELASPDENYDDLQKLDFNLGAIDEGKSSAASVNSVSRASQATGATSTSKSSRLPDFFAHDVFQTVLHNPTTSHQLLRYSQSRLCGENLEFLEKVDRYNALLNDVANNMFEIHRDFISVNAANQINIPDSILIKVNKDLKAALATTLPRLESVFVDAQNDIERLVAMDIYPRFVRHQMTMSAAKALASNRVKYAGLGDCFVLTDPAKADNPIVYASDGFVKVTGYERNEIIPRNCRFLQNRHTDKSAVGRLRDAIQKREESVELLLNQRKTGEPFWNLLYTAPLFDASGNVVFFLGGQINCSTTVHSQSDVLRILAMSNDTDEKAANGVLSPPAPEQKQRPRASRLFSSFRSKQIVEPQGPPGMEETMINKLEKMNLKKQMDTFYTAYSKYIVVNYSTFYISFHSAGIASMLYPTKPVPKNTVSQLVGMDVFRFLEAHAKSKLGSEFKQRVRSSLKMGHATSMDVTLCTRRFMGFERFATHWTPLKNETNEVGFVIMTLGSYQD